MYNDNELLECAVCGGLGVIANDLKLNKQFFHKIPSPDLEGYFTFTLTHEKVECARCGKEVDPTTHPTIGCDY